MAGCIYFLKYIRCYPLWTIPLWISFWILTYLLILGLSMVFFVTLNQEMIKAIQTSNFYPSDVLKTLFQSLPSMLWELVTLQNVAHYFDMLYVVMIELGFLSPICLIVIKRCCQDKNKCV